MTTLLLDLDDGLAEQVDNAARSTGRTPEEVAKSALAYGLQSQAAEIARKAALREGSGMLTGAYGPDFLKDLRSEWD
jgi:predicted transcriptional regulator